MSTNVCTQDLNGIALGAATHDVWSLMATTKRLKLLQLELTSDATVAVDVSVSLSQITAHGSGGSAATPAQVDPRREAPTATTRTADTTQADATGMNQIASWHFDQIEPIKLDLGAVLGIVADLGFGFSLRWNTATAANVSGSVFWAEFVEVLDMRYQL